MEVGGPASEMLLRRDDGAVAPAFAAGLPPPLAAPAAVAAAFVDVVLPRGLCVPAEPLRLGRRDATSPPFDDGADPAALAVAAAVISGTAGGWRGGTTCIARSGGGPAGGPAAITFALRSVT